VESASALTQPQTRRWTPGPRRSAGQAARGAGLPHMDESYRLVLMKTTLNIDDALLRKASALTGVREKTALVRRGLEALIALESARRLAALGGSERKLKPTPRRRTPAA